MTETKNYILDEEVAQRKLRRMALEILENNPEENSIILAGIRGSGSVLARSLQKTLKEISAISIDLIEISLDKRNPREVLLSNSIDLNNKVVIVVDDVANSGRTLLYALKPFLDFQPKKIQVLVLVVRSHTSFPVRPDYVGLSIATTLQEHIYVEVADDRILGAYME